ncbi:hypothetical protein MAR_021503 [Mya arenaria]|uniref:Uncharacterized protein n=1 Tax=Mya arenaria TaxID=6604 RepID=A0ABY7EAE7_MYAAR|nr:hypothetical protein MAR_021503 [Mya arenaria]
MKWVCQLWDTPGKYNRFDLQSKIGAIIGNLPNIIDCAGKGNVNDEQAKEILRHTLTGRIPPGTSIAALEELQNKKGVGCLNVVLPPCNPEWAVTKIIFVQSAADSIPEQLLDMLHDVLSEHDDLKASLFTVITKHDWLKRQEGINTEVTKMPPSRFKISKTEDKLATALGIKNNVGDNCIPWASYCDTVRMPSPKVQNSVLKLLRQIQCPKPVEHTGVPLPRITLLQSWRLNLNAFFTTSSCRTYVLIFVICTLVAAFLWLIAQVRESPNTSSIVHHATGEQINSTGTQ